MKKSTTVKTRTRGYVWIDTCYILDHGWETMVFASDENGNVSNWMDLDSDIYATKSQASDGYEANVVPRSSTYKNFKILQTNCFAVIDNSYSGDSDEWKLPVIAMEDTTINKNDRICQFRINKIQPQIEFEEVEHLDETNRGGFGSTGKN